MSLGEIGAEAAEHFARLLFSASSEETLAIRDIARSLGIVTWARVNTPCRVQLRGIYKSNFEIINQTEETPQLVIKDGPQFKNYGCPYGI